jgi:hemerythrin
MDSKRKKRLMRSVESIKKQIEIHFDKLEKDLESENFDYARYHAKELDKNLIDSLAKRIEMLDGDGGVVERYRERLNKLLERYGIEGF